MISYKSMGIEVFSSPRDHFIELLTDADSQLNLKMLPGVKNYLATMLESHINTNFLFPEVHPDKNEKNPITLAELWLTAHSSDEKLRIGLLRRLGDRALYISGYFSESLQRKIIDVDYYIQMGESAFASLASHTKEDTDRHVYNLLAQRFPKWVDSINFVAQKSFSHSNQGLLRLYENYLKTGSELAYSQLVERGVVTLSQDQLKKAKQDE